MKGFTIFEIVFALALFAILVALGLPVGLDAYRHYLLSSETNNFLNLLRRAQAQSFGNQNTSGHGIYIQSNQYVIFQGGSYASRSSSYDENYPRSTDIAVTGPTEVDFSAVSGNSNVSSTFVFANSAGSRSISINDEGTINW
jgi:Tfp pilus assembly protein FimT